MKAAIAESFNSLVRQRGIDKVTVKAVIEDCGISRQTFYYHFQDIMDVVERVRPSGGGAHGGAQSRRGLPPGSARRANPLHG